MQRADEHAGLHCSYRTLTLHPFEEEFFFAPPQTAELSSKVNGAIESAEKVGTCLFFPLKIFNF